MHQRRSVRTATVQRFTLATLGAIVLAGSMVTAMTWDPLCEVFPKYSLEWYALWCNVTNP